MAQSLVKGWVVQDFELRNFFSVIPVKAGIQILRTKEWPGSPLKAGMTEGSGSFVIQSTRIYFLRQ